MERVSRSFAPPVALRAPVSTTSSWPPQEEITTTIIIIVLKEKNQAATARLAVRPTVETKNNFGIGLC